MAIYIVSSSKENLNNYDGVNLAQQEILCVLHVIRDGNFIFLPEQALFHPKRLLSDVRASDTVYCNIDPYAYLIFLAREELEKEFRIIRNVQTGPWNGYLLQEWLCAPMTRPNDVVLYISNYAKEVFTFWIKETQKYGRHFVCYPEVNDYPYMHRNSDTIKPILFSGYIGRISRDKGFDETMKAFSILHERDNTRRFLVLGMPHPLDYTYEEMENLKTSSQSYGVTFQKPVSHENVFNWIRLCRNLVFASTSNCESLGRIVLEACHCGTPVVAARHAEIPLMIDESSTIEARYKYGLNMSTSWHFPMGFPLPEDIADHVEQDLKLISNSVLSRRKNHWALFLKILKDDMVNDYHDEFCEHLRDLPKARVRNIRRLDFNESIEYSRKVRQAISDLLFNLKNTKMIGSKLFDKSHCKDRTSLFIKRCMGGQITIDDLGGFPMEACHLLDFDPYLELIET